VLARAGIAEHEQAMREVLMAGRVPRDRARRRVHAAIGLALDLATWRRLTAEEGLSDAEAVDVMAAAVEAAAR